MVAYRRGRPCRRAQSGSGVQSPDVLHARGLNCADREVQNFQAECLVIERLTSAAGDDEYWIQLLEQHGGSTAEAATDAQSRSEVQSPDVLRQGSSTARQITSSELSQSVLS
jgi:hypothetical protein